MTSKPVHYPGLISVPRFTTLLVSVLVTLSAGTVYAYSAYAPQLGSRLHITHTQLNIVGLAGNIGAYTCAPLWGRIVDQRGPRILLASSFVLHFVGYSGIKYIFDLGFPTTSTTISTLTFCVLVLCRFMTGAGGNAGLASAVNSTSKTFPDKARGSATGVVISGFGLSAFLFSTVSRVKFAGNPSSFLRLLSLGTAIPMIAGFCFIRPIPLSQSVGPEEGQRSSMVAEEHAREQTPLLDAHEGVPKRTPPNQFLSPNLSGRELWTSNDFWLLFVIFSTLAGTGLTFINNVGAISQALYTTSVEVYEPADAARWQADQVSSISVLNFSGRICIGLVSDYTKSRFSFPRSYSLVIVSSLFFFSQVLVAFVVDDIKNLWIVSATVGLAHGSALSLFPNVCLEWFGMPHFSENWGYLAASPIVAGNVFSFVFGHNLDAHDTSSPAGNSLATAANFVNTTVTGTCTLGRACYVDALYLTTGACFLAVLLSMWAGWRDRKKLGARVMMT